MKKRILRAALAVIMILAINGCMLYAPKSPDMIFVPGEEGHYTYRYADTAPDSWSPLNWSSRQERDILSYTTSPLYDIVLDDAEDSYTLQEALAAAMPEDVTAEYAGKKTYGIPEKAKEGYAYRITIRSDAKWQDGSAITTADFDYSLQQYLDPEAKNSRRSDYYYGYLSLANAQEYIQNGYTLAYDADQGYAEVEDEELLFSMTQINGLFKTSSLEEYYSYFDQDKKALFLDDSSHNIYDQLAELTQGAEYTPLTSEIKALLAVLCRNFGAKGEEDYKKLCFYQDTEHAVTWDQVGFVAEDEYTMVFLLNKPTSVNELACGLSDLLLVKQDIYETDPASYGTSDGRYQSYGPYQLISYDHDNGLELAVNDNWFGWGEEAYTGQYQTTDIQIFYGLGDEEAAARFAQGNLDNRKLGLEEWDEYGDSEFACQVNNIATDIFVVDTDLNDLLAQSKDGENCAILAYKDFRHGISRAIDRYAYRDMMNPKGEAAYGLFGPAYVSNVETGERYRDTAYGTEIIYAVYGKAEDISQIAYYNTESAAKYIEDAYAVCLADGNIRDTDQVVITISSVQDGTAEFLQKALDEACVGTSLEGRVTVRVPESEEEPVNIYECSVSGNEWNPYVMLQNFLDPEYMAEDGFCPEIQKCTIKVGDKNVSITFAQWYYELTQGKYKAVSSDTRMKILAYLERGLLLTYKDIPLYYESEMYLRSFRITSGFENYQNFEAGYGGIRYISYAMDDAEWSRYCEDKRYQLEY